MSGFPNPYFNDRTPSPGEKEVEVGQYLVDLFRWLRVPMPLRRDREAVARTGELLFRWLRNLGR